MSSRALASQRNKRTNAQPSNAQVSSNNATNTNTNNNSNARKELSIPQAFSLLNNRVSNLEKRIFDDNDVIPSTNSSVNMSNNNSNMKEQILNDIKKEVNFNISQDVLNDYNQRIQQLEESSNNNIANPFKTNEPTISNEEFELLKLANTENNKKIVSMERENTVLTETVAHLKDTIINLQNFTLEINNNVLLHINALRNNPLSFIDELSNQAGINHIEEDSDSEINNIEHTLHIDEMDHNSVNPDEIVIVNEEDQIIHEKDEEVSLTEVTNSLKENSEHNDNSQTVLNNTPVSNLSSDNNTDSSDNSVAPIQEIKNDYEGATPDDTIAYY